MVASQKPHVAIFAFPFGTHAAPLLSLCRHLAAHAPDATFSFFSTPKSNASLASTVPAGRGPLPNITIRDLWDGSPPDDVNSGGGGVAPVGRTQEDSIELFLKATPGNMKEALRRAVEEVGDDATCVVSDAFLSSAGEMAEEMGVPWVALWTSGAASLAAHSYTDLLRSTFGTGEDAEKRQDEVLDMLPGCSALRVRDLPGGVVLGPLHSPISLLLHRMAHSLPRAAAVAVNTFHHLDSTVLRHLQANFRSCLPVGPLSLLSPPPPEADASRQCLAWLDGFNHSPASVAYISFGSFMTPPPAELAALAAGLEASGAPFVWSLKEKAWEGLPSGFRARMEGQGRGLLVQWAPQVKLLSHPAVGVFVTHCGWNSVMESISGGVPMICRAFFGEQKLNGRMVSEVWKIGVEVEGEVTEDGLAAAFDLVLRKEEGRGMRERAGALREAAKKAVGDGGSPRAWVDELLPIITPA